jgi:DNA replication licensing factor MCM5
MDYDEDRIYYSYQNLQSQPGRSSSEDQRRSTEYDAELTEDKANASVIRRHFREFLRNYRTNQRYLYREKLLRMHQREGSFIDVDLSHLAEYDSHLLDALLRQPVTAIPAMDAAAKDALKMLLQENIDTLPNVSHGSRADHADALDAGSMSQQLSSVSDIQLLFKGNIAPTPLRSIQSQHIHTIIKCPGIVISSSRLRSKATSLTVRCTR